MPWLARQLFTFEPHENDVALALFAKCFLLMAAKGGLKASHIAQHNKAEGGRQQGVVQFHDQRSRKHSCRWPSGIVSSLDAPVYIPCCLQRRDVKCSPKQRHNECTAILEEEVHTRSHRAFVSCHLLSLLTGTGELLGSRVIGQLFLAHPAGTRPAQPWCQYQTQAIAQANVCSGMQLLSAWACP